MHASQDAAEQAMHDGVLSAVVHVAAVSALDVRDLVAEFAAAQEALDRMRPTLCSEGRLHRAMACGLSPERLKAIAQAHWISGGQLQPLAVSLQACDAHSADDGKTYRALVLQAAYAAAQAPVRSGFVRRRLGMTHLERTALAEIAALLDHRFE